MNRLKVPDAACTGQVFMQTEVQVWNSCTWVQLCTACADVDVVAVRGNAQCFSGDGCSWLCAGKGADFCPIPPQAHPQNCGCLWILPWSVYFLAHDSGVHVTISGPFMGSIWWKHGCSKLKTWLLWAEHVSSGSQYDLQRGKGPFRMCVVSSSW